MPEEAHPFLVPLLTSLGATPLAIRIAHRYRLFDYPVGWKKHTRPTPYIGGGAIMFAFLLGALTLGGEWFRLWPLVLIALCIAAVGMIDDDRGLPASVRILLEVEGAIFLWASGLGWSVFSSEVANLILTIVWVVALINAMNLLDLMDGVAGTVACVSSAGVGILASIQGDPFIAALALSLSGACAGFLVYNLRSPARIYLGDGGSMVIGFVVAGTIAALPMEGQMGGIVLLAAIPLCGVPLFDMAFRIVLRRRRRISLLMAGQDSVANWLHSRLGSTAKVAVVLGAAQAALTAWTLAALGLGDGAVVAYSALCLASALLVGKALLSSAWVRAGDPRPEPAVTPAFSEPRPRRSRRFVRRGVALAAWQSPLVIDHPGTANGNGAEPVLDRSLQSSWEAPAAK